VHVAAPTSSALLVFGGFGCSCRGRAGFAYLAPRYAQRAKESKGYYRDSGIDCTGPAGSRAFTAAAMANVEASSTVPVKARVDDRSWKSASSRKARKSPGVALFKSIKAHRSGIASGRRQLPARHPRKRTRPAPRSQERGGNRYQELLAKHFVSKEAIRADPALRRTAESRGPGEPSRDRQTTTMNRRKY